MASDSEVLMLVLLQVILITMANGDRLTIKRNNESF